MKFRQTMRKTAVAMLVLTALLCGCALPEADFYPLTAGGATQFGEPKSESQVELFITKKPDFKYRELGMLTYQTTPAFNNEPEIYQMLRRKAGEIGADGAIVMDSQSTVETMPRISYDYFGNVIDADTVRSYIKYRAMAIQRIK